jgi:DNA-binding NtrC family response regulator
VDKSTLTINRIRRIVMKKRKRILVVDDEIAIRECLSNFLKRAGYDVSSVSNGDCAFEIIKEDNFSVVISDIKMPGMDGFNLLKKIKELNKNIEVILITGYENDGNAIKSRELGAYAYIKKPIKIQHLEKVLQELFEKSE